MQLTAMKSEEITSARETSLSPRQSWAGIILLVFIICGVIAVAFDVAPGPVNDAALSAFSAGRALQHLSSIASAPHPINSAEHALVRDYILNAFRQVGMSPAVQKTAADDSDDGAGSIENIICRLPGSTHDKAVLLVAHYDSVEEGPGASDDGVAVADILETARALKSQPQLKRDIIFLITDGEEAGLLGAKAFVAKHAWAKDVGVVLNFDARGTTGFSIMFETSAQNGWLISNFGAASSHPVANSLSYEIYKRLPNDTDFTIFRRAGYSGLNFAFINGLGNYHKASDSIKAVDPRSLQHDGDYMMELAKQFGNAAT
ncbi:MAG TPA: M20/M25/M40 family metallo-hydrolase, partial [Candidatus Angelobacter sp.]|nr:M20/M25/M40 family metallo-hydrolase [Candidatus Angelobacter sp.]